MPQSLAQVYLHVIFSTKNREPYLEDANLRQETYAYMSSICRGMKSPSLLIGGVADHVHILCKFARTCTMADLVKEVKRESSLWLKTKDPNLGSFYWQEGYGVFSANPYQVDTLKQYIANQEEHHREESFQDEYRRILREHGVDYDERYVWD